MQDNDPHLKAMAEIRRVLADFPPAEQMAMAASTLANVLCSMEDSRGIPSRGMAYSMLGHATEYVVDQINRAYPRGVSHSVIQFPGNIGR